MIKKFYPYQLRAAFWNSDILKTTKKVLVLCLLGLVANQTSFAQQSCTIQCPGDQNFNCQQVVNYTVNMQGDCPGPITNAFYSIPDTTVAGTNNSVSCNPLAINHYYQVYTGINEYRTASFARVGIVTTWANNGATLTVRLYSLTNTSTPYNVSSTNRVLLGTSPAFPVPNGSAGQKVTVPLGNIAIPAGTTVLIDVESSTEFVVNTIPGSGQLTWIASDPCALSPNTPSLFSSLGFAFDAYVMLYATIPPARVRQTAGLPSGSLFPVGTTTNTFELINPAQQVIDQCSFNVTIASASDPAVATATPTPACEGNNVQLNVTAGATYSWTGPSGFTSSLQSPVLNNVTAANSGVYNVSVTYANGCVAITSINVTVSPAVAATATATPNPVCSGNTVQLGSTGGSLYAWSGPNGFTSTLQNPALTNVQPAATGAYIVTVTANSGCSKTASVYLIVNPTPVTVINADKNPLCTGQSTSLHANGAGSYVWSTGATTPDLAISPTSNTTYTVTGTVGTCTSTASITVSVNASPTITINPPSIEICVNDTISLTANGGSFYVWGTGETTQSIKVHPRETTTYTVTGTSGNGCSNKATATVTVKDFEVGMTVSKASICEGETVSLSVTGGTSYTWTPGNLSGSNVNVKPTVPTTYRVRITGANGCVKYLEVFIDVHPKPIVYINDVKSTTPPPICPGTEVDLRAGGAYSYLWTPDSIPGRIITVAPKTTTRYTVTGSNIWGCTSTASINVPVFAPTSARIESSTGKDPICKGQELTLTVVGLTKPVWWPGKQTTNSITMVPKDIVYAEVTGFDANGCEVTLVFEARTIYCKAPGLVDGANGRGKGEVNVLTVSPNPMNDVSYFRFATPTTERYQMNIMSTDGRLVQSQVIAEGTTVQTISKGNLSKGIYFYQIVSVQGEMVYTGKIAIVE